MARNVVGGVGSLLLVLVACAAVASAGLAAYGPVTAQGRSCGSLLAPGWSDDSVTGPLCEVAQWERYPWVLVPGALGVASTAGWLVLCRRRGAAGSVGPAWEDEPEVRTSPARKQRPSS